MRLRISLLIFGIFCGLGANAQRYLVYVAAESEDEVSLVEFDGKSARSIAVIPVGVWPAEIEGPHGITISPDGKYWFLTLAHGNPFGTLYKYSTGDNELQGRTTLGLFPASMQISTATGLLYCVNFNLHGDMVPSTVSVVDPETMTELTRITTGAMPHGSRISPDGTRHYSVAMMSGELFEIDALRLQVSRVLNLDEAGNQHHAHHASHQGHEAHGSPEMKHSVVKPTWVIPHPEWEKVYVAGNGSDQVLEIDLEKWEITRKFSTGKGPYNVEVSPDGEKMVVTYKSEGSTGIWDLKSGKELANIPNSRKVSHGIAIAPDNKFAFVSVEGIGGEPGAVDVIDMDNLALVATAEIGKQAGGIGFWKMEP
jgi:DNA-binding beta-propeller fold protein YncE